MDQDSILPVAIIGTVIWLWIMYEIIKGAVRSATRDMNYNLKMQNRLMIKQLEKMGVSKQELIDLHNGDSDAFWNSVK